MAEPAKSASDQPATGGWNRYLGSALWTLALVLPVLAAALAFSGFRGRDVLLGVDLGTTFSAVAARRDGVGVAPLRNLGGRWTTPSIVAAGLDGTFLVGSAAEAFLRSHPHLAVMDAKRVLGRDLWDPVALAEAGRHAGRLVQHPTALRSRLTGRVVPAAKRKALCKAIARRGARGDCFHDVAFAIPLDRHPEPARRALASHLCIDTGSLVSASPAPGSAPLLGPSAPALASLSASLNSSAFLLVTPQAAGCLVVKYLVASAEAALGHGGMVKTMAAAPAEFRGAQRAATAEAFARAGLSVVRMLDEPTAAALAYGLHQAPHVHAVLVFDMGGGTLDVSVLFAATDSMGEGEEGRAAGAVPGGRKGRASRSAGSRQGGSDGAAVEGDGSWEDSERNGSGGDAEAEDKRSRGAACTPRGAAGPDASGGAPSTGRKGSFTVIGTAGDNSLGGEDVDDCVAELLSAQLAAAGSQSPSSAAPGCPPEVLTLEAERVKIALSGDGGDGAAEEVAWSCGADMTGDREAAAAEGARAAGGVLSRAAFEAGCAHLFDRALLPVGAALENAGLSHAEIDEVVLVGGSSRLPAIRQRLQHAFAGRPLRHTVDPDLAVAIGAAAAGD